MDTFEIPSERIESFRKRVGSLLKRADRKGLTGYVSIKERAPEIRTKQIKNPDWDGRSTDDQMIEVTFEVYPVDIEVNEPLSLGGWTLVGVIEPPLPNVDVNTVTNCDRSGAILPEKFWKGDWQTCDHCNASRQRRECFIVKNADGEYRQVGRQCLRDFLGHDPMKFIAFFTFINEAKILCDENTEPKMRDRWLHPTAKIIHHACRVVCKRGYVSRQQAQDTGKDCTVALVMSWICCWDGKIRRELDESYPDTDESRLLETKVMDWAKSVTDRTFDQMATDYERSIWATLKSGYSDWRSSGLAIGMIPGMIRDQKKAAVADANKAINEKSQHMGHVGERLRDLSVTVLRTKLFTNDFGGTTLVEMVTTDGNILNWWGSGILSINEKDELLITGTVKEHIINKYRDGAKCTVITRCRWASVKKESIDVA